MTRVKSELNKVSVVIPSYNRRRTIKKCIDSVLEQSYPACEIIVIDDGSTDGTVELLKGTYGSAVSVIEQGHKGAQAARNLGIQTARGEFIVFLDSDDCLTPTSLEDRLEVFCKHPEYDMVYGDVAVAQHIVRFEKIQEYASRKYLLEELSLCPFSVIMVRKKVFNNMPMLDTGYKSWQDDEFIMKLEFYGHKMYHCEKVVAKMSWGADQISKNYESQYQGCRKIVKQYEREIKKETTSARLILWKMRVLRDWLQKEYMCRGNTIQRGIYQAAFLAVDSICSKHFRHIAG